MVGKGTQAKAKSTAERGLSGKVDSRPGRVSQSGQRLMSEH